MRTDSRFQVYALNIHAGYVCRHSGVCCAGWDIGAEARVVHHLVTQLEEALAVLRVESVRHAAAAGRALDAELIVDAIRAADLLTVHQSRSEEIVRTLGRVERQSSSEWLAALGLEVPPRSAPSTACHAGVDPDSR